MVFIAGITISAIVAIMFGIIILIWPKFLNVLVGLYLLIVGVLQLIGAYQGA